MPFWPFRRSPPAAGTQQQNYNPLSPRTTVPRPRRSDVEALGRSSESSHTECPPAWGEKETKLWVQNASNHSLLAILRARDYAERVAASERANASCSSVEFDPQVRSQIPPRLTLTMPVTVYEIKSRRSSVDDKEIMDWMAEAEVDISDEGSYSSEEEMEYISDDGSDLSDEPLRGRSPRPRPCTATGYVPLNHRFGGFPSSEPVHLEPTIGTAREDLEAIAEDEEPTEEARLAEAREMAIRAIQPDPNAPPFPPFSKGGKTRLALIKSAFCLPSDTHPRGVQNFLAENTSLFRHIAVGTIPHPDWAFAYGPTISEVHVADKTARDVNYMLFKAILEVYWEDQRLRDVISLALSQGEAEVKRWLFHHGHRRARVNTLPREVHLRVMDQDPEYRQIVKTDYERTVRKRKARPCSLLSQEVGFDDVVERDVSHVQNCSRLADDPRQENRTNQKSGDQTEQESELGGEHISARDGCSDSTSEYSSSENSASDSEAEVDDERRPTPSTRRRCSL